jgi:hypothetical protein
MPHKLIDSYTQELATRAALPTQRSVSPGILWEMVELESGSFTIKRNGHFHCSYALRDGAEEFMRNVRKYNSQVY